MRTFAIFIPSHYRSGGGGRQRLGSRSSPPPFRLPSFSFLRAEYLSSRAIDPSESLRPWWLGQCSFVLFGSPLVVCLFLRLGAWGRGRVCIAVVHPSLSLSISLSICSSMSLPFPWACVPAFGGPALSGSVIFAVSGGRLLLPVWSSACSVSGS